MFIKSFTGSIFDFGEMSILETGREICNLIDLEILIPEDLEFFIDSIILSGQQSTYNELCSIFKKE